MTLTPFTTAFKKLRSGVSLDPERDWIMLLMIGAVLLTAIILWNVWTFNTVASGGAIGRPTPKSKPIFDQASLDAINATFQARASEEAKYVTGVYHFDNPSQ